MANECNAQKKLYSKLDAIIAKWRDESGGLIPIMQGAQEIFGCINEEIQTYVAESLNIPVSTVYGISTFYSLFALQAKGKYVIGLCLGTACYVRGAQALVDELQKQLKVEIGQTTQDGLFTLDATRCIGCCGLAPAMMINDEVYGELKPDDIPRILENYRNQ
ncbi:MAG: NADH-quinone oxidoreductase subunit NuoE [Clostridiales bacterium]|nr:NADH-quinone oxidoreductase subunit NuoE [Clostridiales bacterium]